MTKVVIESLGGEYTVSAKGFSHTYRRDEFNKRFDFAEADKNSTSDWKLLHEGLCEAFPEHANNVEARLQQHGVDWVWPFTRSGIIEQQICPYGMIAAWEQGTGKTRLALAMALLSGKQSLIVVDARLVDELKIEIEKIDLDPSLWKIIQNTEDTRELKSINIISYSTLKKQVIEPKGRSSRNLSIVRGRDMLANYLRRRIHTVLCDEGGLLKNNNTLQTRAVNQVAPRKTIILDGTPTDYPRDLHPLAAITAGNGVAHQKFGVRNTMEVTPQLLTSASYTRRGVKAFIDDHVVLDWATHEWMENGRSGAKREIPAVNKVPEYRQWLSPFVQRKIRKEPECAPFTSCPDPHYKTVTLKWDREHLAYYLTVAKNIAEWILASFEEARESGKGANLTVALQKISAAIGAANSPHKPRKNVPKVYSPLTSKQRYMIDRCRGLSEEGRKIICHVDSPAVADLLHVELSKVGVKSVLFHGDINIDKRTETMHREFRNGDDGCVLLATGVGQRGLNLPQASVILLGSRNWSGKFEDQFIARTQRPEQTESVLIERIHLEGSVDEYQHQCVDWKLAAALEGLDFGDNATESEEYYHMEAILEKFCRETLGMTLHEATEQLAA